MFERQKLEKEEGKAYTDPNVRSPRWGVSQLGSPNEGAFKALHAATRLEFTLQSWKCAILDLPRSLDRKQGRYRQIKDHVAWFSQRDNLGASYVQLKYSICCAVAMWLCEMWITSM
jgi:hypothetical protein